MEDLLQNPVYNALLTGDKHFSNGNSYVKYFDKEVSPFVGFDKSYTNGFADLHDIFPAERLILFATPGRINEPAGWQLQHEIMGLQFVYKASDKIQHNFNEIKILGKEDIDQMLNLAKITKPGPFGLRTIEFGFYHGIFNKHKLVAMTGQRMHINNFTEISSVCTLPGYTGRGYANTLLLHQLQIILKNGQQPFLHVRADNERAIALYKTIGFVVSSAMNFYFMKKS